MKIDKVQLHQMSSSEQLFNIMTKGINIPLLLFKLDLTRDSHTSFGRKLQLCEPIP